MRSYLVNDAPQKYEVVLRQQEELFNALITERDVLIQGILASEDTEFVKKFAELELVVNNELKGMAQSLLKSAKDDVSRFIRSQAAIKKYK